MGTKEINIKALKKFAKKNLKDYLITSESILEEPDDMPHEEYVKKVKIWLQALEMEKKIVDSKG
ncbi:MAG: hypothetical protein COS47_01390 [Candidatus Nealsonbacteria bacterium CG03_land_8_20_14_0_80_36_12]|uniref:Uncharacterized protein n=1 Tax=Candidatus Nealsonbacteria bacterium CG03_land_8_20_14_0_80_36_12 TaxID=1974701 RepID=A0A2M7BYB7_9BACT|nr:MAG: hypothetical protein COS47_01390 [Candidatus Nealsonbacteria bacterium CG03_land_8_20_14_0_80_36_12]